MLLVSDTAAQREHPNSPTQSGGPISFEQAAYDVTSYDISVSVDPKNQSISGTVLMDARIVIPTRIITLDLDTTFDVSSVMVWKQDAFAPARYEREGERSGSSSI